ncbi:LysR substrate-binding domain-containing protein [Methylobacterium sp. JK268]
MRPRTPPLSALRLFDAAGRHLSFARAASELNLTPSAVSHGIVGLEKALGVKLFIREPGRLALTREGADYLTYVSEALSIIQIGTRRLPPPRAGRTLAISCAPTLASRWLLPRLPAFRARHPRIAVRIDTSHRHVGFPIDGFDFAIRMSRNPAAMLRGTRLFDDWLVPVCSPAYRDAQAGRDGAVDWRRATLIHVTSITEDWQAWFDATGEAEPPSGDSLHVDTFGLSLEAAAAGLGIALGRRSLMDREVRDRTLVAVGPARPAATSHWLVSPEKGDEHRDLADFRDWLLAEAERFAADQRERFPFGPADEG